MDFQLAVDELCPQQFLYFVISVMTSLNVVSEALTVGCGVYWAVLVIINTVKPGSRVGMARYRMVGYPRIRPQPSHFKVISHNELYSNYRTVQGVVSCLYPNSCHSLRCQLATVWIKEGMRSHANQQTWEERFVSYNLRSMFC